MKKLILLIAALLALMLFLPAWMSLPQEKQKIPQFRITEAYLCNVQGSQWTEREGSSYIAGELVFVYIVNENPIVIENDLGKHNWLTADVRLIDQNDKVWFDRKVYDEKYYLKPDDEIVRFYLFYSLWTAHPGLKLPLGNYKLTFDVKDKYSGMSDSISVSFSIISYTEI